MLSIIISLHSFVFLMFTDTFVTSDGTQRRLGGKIKQRMNKRQRSKDILPPKAKRPRHTKDLSPVESQRQGAKKELSRSKPQGMVRFVKGGRKTKGGGFRSGGRVFRKKTGRSTM